VAGRHKRLMKSRLGSVTRTACFLDVSDGRGADGITLKDRWPQCRLPPQFTEPIAD
jgi:hypothetical protein